MVDILNNVNNLNENKTFASIYIVFNFVKKYTTI